MFENTIEFIANEAYFDNPQAKKDFPKPTKFYIPDWFKNLKTTRKYSTIKSCVPFLDSLITGYTLVLPQDIYIKHNFKEGELNGTTFEPAMRHMADHCRKLNLNINFESNIHPIEQVGGKSCPLAEKNKNLPFHKIMNPWKIKTPKGYSCLFIPPLNNRDDRFEILSGIVDTDTHPLEINFPFIINGDKYPTLETVLERGTPYVQIIPFKRENWKMKINSETILQSTKTYTYFHLFDIDRYKKMFWNKKSWK